MKVSVALCTFNGARHLADQLASISCQTTRPDEIILCDDGSEDDTIAIAQRFAEQSGIVMHIHRNPTRLGSVANFEQAIRLCTGDIILLCDQDDEWLPDRVEHSVHTLTTTNAGYVVSDAELMDDDDQPLNEQLWNKVDFTAADRERFNRGALQGRLLMRQPFVTGATMAFRAELRVLFLPIPQRIQPKFHHDRWIALSLSMHGHYGHALAEPLIRYRLHGKQQVGVRGRKSLFGLWLRRIGRRLKPLRQRALYRRILDPFKQSCPEEYQRQFG